MLCIALVLLSATVYIIQPCFF